MTPDGDRKSSAPPIQILVPETEKKPATLRLVTALLGLGLAAGQPAAFGLSLRRMLQNEVTKEICLREFIDPGRGFRQPRIRKSSLFAGNP
jgi:hypothetical protein